VPFKIIMTMSVTRPCFSTQHNTRFTRPRPERARPRPRSILLVSDRSFPKTDGLRPYHWLLLWPRRLCFYWH